MPRESTKKRKGTFSAFDQVANLELEDKTAEKLRRKQTVKDVTRAKAARSQTKIYGTLMETRILLQRTLQQAEVYAQQQQNEDKREKEEDESDDDDDTSDNEQATTAAALEEECDDLLERLLQARRQMVPALKKQKKDNNDNNTPMEQILESEYNTCQQEWKDVLNRRHQDLKLHAGLASSSKTQFRVLDSSFWQQVESTVNHEEMRQRSQHAATDGTSDTVFDDSKVYQRMLKDFLVIASSSTGGTDAATDTTGYQRWKSPHPKKQVDRKASKGRKIRYVEIPKLVNFTFPISRTSNTNLDGDEWFKSLFGGAGNLSTNKSNTSSAGAMLVSSGDAESD